MIKYMAHTNLSVSLTNNLALFELLYWKLLP